MTKRISTAPTKLFLHRDSQVDREFSNIYSLFQRLNFGPFRVDYDATTQTLFVSVFDEDDQKTVSVAEIAMATGNVKLKGTLAQSQTLTEYARG